MESTMEGIKFMSSIAATSITDKLESAASQVREQVRDGAERVRDGAERVRQTASDTASSAVATCGSIDITKLELSSTSVSALGTSVRDSTLSGVSALGSTMSRVAEASWSVPIGNVGRAAGSAGGSSAEAATRGRAGSLEEGSDSGADDAAWGASSFSSNVAARLGMGGASNSEKERLVKPEKGLGSAGAAGASWTSVSSGIQGIGQLGSSLGSSLGSGLGLSAAPKPREPEGVLEKACSCCPAMTYRQRLAGFAVCSVMGLLLSISALTSLGGLLVGNPGPFAFKYTLGNLLSLASSTFMVGPAKQCRDMASPERRVASLVYVCSLCGTVWALFVAKLRIVSFVFVILQFGALTWYMFSYVPYGRAFLTRCVGRLVG